MKKQLLYPGMILLAAIIWGSAFVAQNKALQVMGPFTLLAIRSWIGVAAVAPFCYLADRRAKQRGGLPAGYRKALLIAGLTCGGSLFLGSILQNYGMLTTSVGKSGFLTALYMVMTPLLAWCIGKRPSKLVWGAVAVTVLGMYLLCIKPGESFALAIGDLYLIACAFFMAVQILAVDRYAANLNGFYVACAQMLVMAICSTAPALIFETLTWEQFCIGFLPTVYVGVFSNAVAFTLQIMGQKNTPPAIASLFMSMESVFAALFGWLLLRERLSGRELLGCGLVFAAIIIVQTPGLVMMFRQRKMKKTME